LLKIKQKSKKVKDKEIIFYSGEKYISGSGSVKNEYRSKALVRSGAEGIFWLLTVCIFLAQLSGSYPVAGC